MEKLNVPDNRLIDGERVSKPVEKKIDKIVDWINAHDERLEEARKMVLEQFEHEEH